VFHNSDCSRSDKIDSAEIYFKRRHCHVVGIPLDITKYMQIFLRKICDAQKTCLLSFEIETYIIQIAWYSPKSVIAWPSEAYVVNCQFFVALDEITDSQQGWVKLVIWSLDGLYFCIRIQARRLDSTIVPHGLPTSRFTNAGQLRQSSEFLRS
jgi:hypothetical protein